MVLFFVPVILTLPALNDLFVHAATLERLKEDFWNPRDPMVDEPGLGNPYFSPYMVFLSSVAKLSGMSTFVVLRLAGAFNLILFLVGLGLFVRTLSTRRMAQLFSLAAIFFLWGTRFFYWSGFVSFPSLIASIAYPSTFAVGMGLLLWSLLAEIVDVSHKQRTRILLFGAIAVGATFVLLSHQFTALGVSIYAGFYVFERRRIISLKVWVGFGAITVVVLIAACLWPWYSLFGSTGGVEAFNAVHKPLYEDLFRRYGLLVLAIPALCSRFVRNKCDPLTLTVVVCFAVFIWGGVSGNFFLARIFPPVALLSQIAVGVSVSQWLGTGRKRWQRLYAAVACVGMFTGVVFQSGFVNLLVPGSYPDAWDKTFGSRMTKGDYLWLTEHAGFGDSVMTTNWDARVMAPGYGIFTVMPAWPDPFLGDAEEQRRLDSREFMRNTTTATRRHELMNKYGATWVIVVDKDAKKFRSDINFAWVAERPDTGTREEYTENGRQQLFRYSAK